VLTTKTRVVGMTRIMLGEVASLSVQAGLTTEQYIALLELIIVVVDEAVIKAEDPN